MTQASATWVAAALLTYTAYVCFSHSPDRWGCLCVLIVLLCSVLGQDRLYIFIGKYFYMYLRTGRFRSGSPLPVLAHSQRMAAPCLRAASFLLLSMKWFSCGHIHSNDTWEQTLAHEWPRDWIVSVDLKYVYFIGVALSQSTGLLC